MSVDALDYYAVLDSLLWILLAIAVGVWVLAAAWIVARFVSRRLEDRYLPGVARWSHRRAGLADDAGPWACPACHSVNGATGATCYRCGRPRAEAPELTAAATDPGVYHAPASAGAFYPSLYLGPGAPPSAGE